MAPSRKKKQEAGTDIFSSLIKRFTIFLLLFLAVMLLLYFSGNFQAFLDSSLRIILFSSSLLSLLLISFSAVGFVSSLVLLAGRRQAGYAAALLFYLLTAAAGTAVFIALRGLAVLTAGIR
ncbi:MAG: hypothetical protein II932_03500 [Treponema sp.]|nr:hypothetical protein [Treponema sp.]